jgi:hypothetical protein
MTPPTHSSNTSDSVSTAAGARRELAHRESDGITVQLLWESDVDALTLSVEDGRAGIFFELPVARDRGLEAFHHPFAHAYAAGLGFGDACESLDLQPQS